MNDNTTRLFYKSYVHFELELVLIKVVTTLFFNANWLDFCIKTQVLQYNQTSKHLISSSMCMCLRTFDFHFQLTVVKVYTNLCYNIKTCVGWIQRAQWNVR